MKSGSKIFLIIEGTSEDVFFVEANEIISKLDNHEVIDVCGFENVKIGVFKQSNKIDEMTVFKQLEDNDGKIMKQYLDRTSSEKSHSLQIETDEIIYYLRIRPKDAKFDAVSLRYLPMLRKRYGQNNRNQKIFIGLLADSGDEYRISHYMFMESMREMNSWRSHWRNKSNNLELRDSLSVSNESLKMNTPYNRLFFVRGSIRRLQVHGIGSLNKIVPCFCMDWEWFDLFSDSIGQDISYNSHFGDMPDDHFQFEKVNISKDYILKLQEEFLKGSGTKWKKQDCYHVNMEKSEWRKLLYKVVLRDICLDNLKDAKVISEDDEGKLMIKQCGEMSYLSLLLLSTYCHFIFENTKRSLTEIEVLQLIEITQDFANGLLQLLENAMAHAEQSCFSIRVHSSSSEYLTNNYSSCKIDDNFYYLEVLISDINYGQDLTRKFIQNIKKREIPKKLMDKIEKKISLEGFFKPDNEMRSLWDEYYEIPDNIINHYGLLLFDSIVRIYRGFFMVHSGDNHCVMNYTQEGTSPINMQRHFPGTHYSILLPITRRDVSQRVGLSVKPDLNDQSLRENWINNHVDISSIFLSMHLNEEDSHIVRKEKAIECCTTRCIERYVSKQVYVINTGTCHDPRDIEIFAKSLIKFIMHTAKENKKEKLRIALIHSTYAFMTQFTRYFAAVYNKGEFKAMKNAQLFICDQELKNEIVFAGTSLKTAFASNNYWANAQGVYNRCFETIQIILDQRIDWKGSSSKKLEIVPFELLVEEQGNTLFENRVIMDMKSDIQDEEFGCKLNEVHMRVGSKMHVIDHFYEPSQLFSSKLYNSRFAYLLTQKIIDTVGKGTNFVLVGYDVYSELLLIEIKNTLEDLHKINTHYIIFESTPHPKFRMWNESMRNNGFIIIVPTNTTLTTHGKIITELRKKMQENQDDISFEPKILLNLAVVLIRDSSTKSEEGEDCKNNEKVSKNLTIVEKKYWHIFRDDMKLVESKTMEPSQVYYNILVDSKWQEPLVCEYCYPMTRLIDEKPIIEVDHSSVVPMILAGPKQSSLGQIKQAMNVPHGDVELLKSVMYYGHIKRGSNHFQYYFKTDELIQLIISKGAESSNFKTWLDYIEGEIKKQVSDYQKTIEREKEEVPYIYDILVAPFHETNASFMEQINANVFHGVPLIVYMDADKEYRENILSKYSNLTALYNNIAQKDRIAIINFHYIDDTINSGNSFRRTSSLLHSLFPDEAYKNTARIKVNLFQNIILLINRSSNSTISDYVSGENFFAYFQLKISSLRNHHDNACALCAQLADYHKLQERSTMACISNYWKNRIENKRPKDINEAVMPEVDKREIYVRRMICTHELNKCLIELGWERNNTNKVKITINNFMTNYIDKMPANAKNRIETALAFITVLSRPYLVYRKSVLDVVFSMLLEIMEEIFKYQKGHEQDVNGFIGSIFKEFNNLEEVEYGEVMKNFLVVMLTSLAELRSSYLIRSDVMNKIFKLIDELILDASERDDFIKLYVAVIKKTITLSKDETIGLWLEHLLVNEREYHGDKQLDAVVDKDFKTLLFYENTCIIADAVEELVYKKAKDKKSIGKYVQEYYFDNFRKQMNLNYNTDLSKKMQLDDEKWKCVRGVLLAMILLMECLDDKERSYSDIAAYMKDITSSKHVSIYGIDNMDAVYRIASTENFYYDPSDFYEKNEKRKKDNKVPKYFKDSVYLSDDNIVLLCLSNQEYNSDDVWAMIRFEDTVQPSFTDMFLSIRYILVLRHALWERLQHDFRNNVFYELKKLSLKNELLIGPKAGSHTTDEQLRKIARDLKQIQEKDGEEVFTWASSLLQLASDSMISKLYVESIANEDRTQVKCEELSTSIGTFELTPAIKCMLEKITYVNREQEEAAPTSVEVQTDIECFKYKYRGNKDFYILYIISAFVQNAVKYGRAESGKVKVDISIDECNLIICNELKEGCQDKTDQSGITLVAIEYFIKTYYKGTMKKGDAKTGFFEVSIPVIWIGEEDNEGALC